MIYSDITNNDPIKIFLKLEELIVLSKLTEQECAISNFSSHDDILDLSYFLKTDKIPNVLNFDISDYVCVYDDEINDIECSEFLKYRKNQFGRIFRLDKINNQDINISMSKCNLYESKYFSLKHTYKDAIFAGSQFNLNQKYIEKFSYLKKIILNIPLVIFEPTMMNSLSGDYSFGFRDCYYISDIKTEVIPSFFKKHNINAINFREFLNNFSISLEKENEKLISIVLVDCFYDIYGMPNNDLFSILSKFKYLKDKNWHPKIIGKYNFATIDNFEFRTVNKSAIFSFAQKNFNLSRIDILSLLRFVECVDY